MSMATWQGPGPQSEDALPLPLLRALLQEMMRHFGASGGCLALRDGTINQMVVCLHLRAGGMADVARPAVPASAASSVGTTAAIERSSCVPPVSPLSPSMPGSMPVPAPTPLSPSPSPSAPAESALAGSPSSPVPGATRRPHGLLSAGAAGAGQPAPSTPPVGEIEDVASETDPLFPVGSAYPPGYDLIGTVWRTGDPYLIRHEEFLSVYRQAERMPALDFRPTRYLVLPIKEPTLPDEVRGKKRRPDTLGIIVLYQTEDSAAPVFQQRQRHEAQLYTDRIALYLQNEQLRRAQQRSKDYLQRLQVISGAFPATAQLSDLLAQTARFAASVVDFSSMLVTLYDRDSKRIFDVYAINHGQLVANLPDLEHTAQPEQRPVWWKITQQEKRPLSFAPTQKHPEEYDELLGGAWGDQHGAESFLLLPMKMFNRVTGTLCLTSARPNVYTPEKILMLETMVQIITVGIENVKLYDKAHVSLRTAQERGEMEAAMNSALQSISTMLDLNELLHKFVEMAGRMVQAEMCAFFQFSREKDVLIAQAMYAQPKSSNEENELLALARDKTHNELIKSIHLPFKDSLLAKKAEESFFYLEPWEAEELARHSNEGGAIFLRETEFQKMLMVPLVYQTDLVGMLAVHLPAPRRAFRPSEIGMLLAICAQTASAIRNAQLFEELQETNAELQHLNRLKDEFLVTASHELRTPLSAISGYSSLLKRQSGRITSQQILRFASKISGAAQQLGDLVANMTEASKIGTVDKKLDLQLSEVQLAAAVEIAISMLSVNIEQKIAAEVAQNLWARGDPLRVRQVISNLLDNAAKYSPPDSTIELTCMATTLAHVPLPVESESLIAENPDLPVIVLRVRDEGEGIQEEEQEKIFEKFVRLPRSLTTPVRGSGLGLYISRRYIEAMGGKLWLERSIPGEGSTFTFYLPRVPAPEMGKQDDASETEYQTP